MVMAVEQARAAGRLRRGPARPGVIGGMFAWSLEPPVRLKTPVAPGAFLDVAIAAHDGRQLLAA
jgi:hypothetical protein